MNDKLKGLPDDALVRLKLQVDAEFKLRKGKLFAIGKLATFFSEKHDREIQVKITGRGPKNVQAVECDDYGNPIGSARWRIHPSFLMPVLPKPKPVVTPTGAGKDRPTAVPGGAW